MDWMLMPLKRYADFSGRSRRMEFWMWQLFQLLIYVGVIVIVMVLGGGAMMGGDPSAMVAAGGGILIVMMIYLLYCLAVIVPSIAVAVRRLHDTNRTGWWILAPLGPYLIAFVLAAMAAAASSGENAGAAMGAIGIIALVCMLAALVLAIVLLVFYFLDGTPGPNNYGADPKGRDVSQTFS